jgi:hypothetical protein
VRAFRDPLIYRVMDIEASAAAHGAPQGQAPMRGFAARPTLSWASFTH